MAEPASSTVAVAIAAGTITLTGSILGLQYGYLMAGLSGGLMALSMAEPTTRLRMATSVAISALAAGYATPVLVAFANEYLAWTGRVAHDAFELFCAAGIGVSAHTALPGGMAWLKKRIWGAP
jgi:hypothetical protein